MYQSPYQMMYQNPYLNSYQQNIQPQMAKGLDGKIVNNFNEITASDVPMNGSVAVFVKNDLSEVEIRSWGNDGTISKTGYKPIEIIKPNNSSPNTLQSGFGANLEVTEAFKQEITDRFDRLEKMITENQPRKERTSGKNE